MNFILTEKPNPKNIFSRSLSYDFISACAPAVSQEIIYGNITRIWQPRIMNFLPVAENAQLCFII